MRRLCKTQYGSRCAAFSPGGLGVAGFAEGAGDVVARANGDGLQVGPRERAIEVLKGKIDWLEADHARFMEDRS